MTRRRLLALVAVLIVTAWYLADVGAPPQLRLEEGGHSLANPSCPSPSDQGRSLP